MEGRSARRYAKLRGTEPQLAAYRRQAVELTGHLADGAAILEVAPGPGYLSVELARLDRFAVTGLDVSHTFVALARELALDAGVSVDFHQGDVTAMPFPDGEFDLVVCQAAFKNFARPVTALNEIHRVLRTGGRAIVQDMSAEATSEAIAAEVAGMQTGRLAALTTRVILTGLRRRAYTPGQFDALARESTFADASITTAGIGLEVTLIKVDR